METFKINIVNPKAVKLLKDLADMDLITIQKEPKDNFLDVVKRLRKKTLIPPTFEEITQEVELVRARRYAK